MTVRASAADEHVAIREHIERVLRDEPSVDVAVLYGSVARGDQRLDSDVDLVIGGGADSMLRLGELGLLLEQTLGRAVDVVDLADARSEPRFMLEVIDQGELVLDRTGTWATVRGARDHVAEAARARQQERTLAAHAGWAVLSR